MRILLKDSTELELLELLELVAPLVVVDDPRNNGALKIHELIEFASIITYLRNVSKIDFVKPNIDLIVV